MNGCLKYLILVITWPISLPIIVSINVIKTIKNDNKYIKYKKEMNKKYNKGYCPIINNTCSYGYCEFWNEQTKDCDLKK